MAPDSHGVGPDTPDRRLAQLDELRQAERRAAISRVASVIGHLIGTPLNVIAGRAALIRANPAAEAALENAQRIEQQVERLALRIRRLIDYLTAPEPEPMTSLVDVVVRDALALYTPIARERGVRVELQTAELPHARIDATSSMIVLTSLLGLAARAVQKTGAVHLGVSLQQATVSFHVTVPGLSMPHARLDRLDPPEDADGIDAERLQVLSVCFAIARRHGGRVDFVDQEGGGAFLFECQAS